jgi:hypothetical protein
MYENNISNYIQRLTKYIKKKKISGYVYVVLLAHSCCAPTIAYRRSIQDKTSNQVPSYKNTTAPGTDFEPLTC